MICFHIISDTAIIRWKIPKVIPYRIEIARHRSCVQMGHLDTGDSTLIPTLTPSPFAGLMALFLMNPFRKNLYPNQARMIHNCAVSYYSTLIHALREIHLNLKGD